MVRSRNRLHVSKLPDFAAFCTSKGWVLGNEQGYEALRMHKGHAMLTVYRRDSTGAGKPLVHLTCWGWSEKMLSKYLQAKGPRDDADS